MMDPASRFLDDVKAGTQTGIGKEFLQYSKQRADTPALDERVPEIVEYPLEEVVHFKNILL